MNKKNSVLITGSSSGFGKLTAKLLASSGFKVFATMRKIKGKNKQVRSQMLKWASKNKYYLEIVELDVTDERSIKKAVLYVNETAGIDVLVNNAGLFCEGINEGFTLEQIKSVFDVNFYGVARMNRAILPLMRKRKSGLIIYVSSGAGRITSPFMGIYSASKFALEAPGE